MPPAPVPAGCDGLRGSIGVTLGSTWLNGDAVNRPEADEFDSALVELRLGYDFSSSLYGQLDVMGEFTDVDNSMPDSYQDGLGAAFHLMYTNDGCCGIGIFGGLFETTQDNNNTDTSERYLVGIEGLAGVGGFDLHWQVGGLFGDGGTDDLGEDSLTDFYFGRLVASKSLGNGWRVGAEVSYGEGDMDNYLDSIEYYGWGAFVEKQLGTDWILALVYDGARYDQPEENDVITEHFVGLNARYYFGAGTSEECAPKLTLPRVMRWMALTGGPLE
ncbi:MAG: hypothetical protein KJO79_03760 [Verrucomicrobiae bacterium]|nr:hypothetical protein [Verrucomicrobiae bacterium]NNJ86274.1 hypothetical protein [Akkermansiaceae bacterium]